MSKPNSDSHHPRSRRNFSPAEKVRILRLHLLEGRPISEVCREADIAPTLFYLWQRTFFENGAAAFTPSSGAAQAQDKLVAKLQEKLVRKDEVIAAVTEELVQTKKELGES